MLTQKTSLAVDNACFSMALCNGNPPGLHGDSSDAALVLTPPPSQMKRCVLEEVKEKGDLNTRKYNAKKEKPHTVA